MNALYTGGLRKIYNNSIPRNLTVYKWCGTKVAHCICQFYNNIRQSGQNAVSVDFRQQV